MKLRQRCCPLHNLAAQTLKNDCCTAVAPDFISHALDLQPWLNSIFLHLHEAPELSFTEIATSALVQAQLEQHNITSHARIAETFAETGVIASVGRGSPVVYLRADMDALPISEEPSHSPR